MKFTNKPPTVRRLRVKFEEDVSLEARFEKALANPEYRWKTTEIHLTATAIKHGLPAAKFRDWVRARVNTN